MLRAFTLIETLIYLGLLSLLLSGAFVAAYTNAELSIRNETIAYVESEGTWAQSILQKQIAQSQTISIEDNGTRIILTNATSSMRLYLSHAQLVLEGEKAEILTSENLRLLNLTFTSTTIDSQIRITTAFTATATTTDGHMVLRTFLFSNYITI